MSECESDTNGSHVGSFQRLNESALGLLGHAESLVVGRKVLDREVAIDIEYIEEPEHSNSEVGILGSLGALCLEGGGVMKDDE
jgi:hypothetical protein